MHALDATARDRHAEAWRLPAYGRYSPGAEYADLFASLAAPGASVLDAGCGAGAGMAALDARGFRVFGCDVTLEALPESRWAQAATANLWRARDLSAVAYLARVSVAIPGERFDWGYCCDVLEHLPPAFTMLVVQNLLQTCDRLFLAVCLVEDGFGVWVGQPLHLTVQPFMAWRDQLREIGRVVEARDLGANAIFVVEPIR